MIGMPADGAGYVPRESVLQDLLQTYALLNPTARAQAKANLAQTLAGTDQTKAGTGFTTAQTAEIPDQAAHAWATEGVQQQQADTDEARNALTQKQIEQTGQLESRHLDITDAMNKITQQFQNAELAEKQRASKVAEGQADTRLGYEGASVGANVAATGAGIGETNARTGLINKQTSLAGVQQALPLLQTLMYGLPTLGASAGPALAQSILRQVAPEVAKQSAAKAAQDESDRQALLQRLNTGNSNEAGRASAASGIENSLMNAIPIVGGIHNVKRLLQALPVSLFPQHRAPASPPASGTQPAPSSSHTAPLPSLSSASAAPLPSDPVASASGPSIFDYLFGGANPDLTPPTDGSPPIADPNLYMGTPPPRRVVQPQPNLFLGTGLPTLQ